MNFLEPSYQHFAYSHDQLPADLSEYSEAQAMFTYNMAGQSGAMVGLPNLTTKPNETKPRLGKDEVEILEREFQKNPKPTTQTKRGFAEEMCVDLARINNWFQNRRAKRKQEKKQEAYETGQNNETLAYSEPSSPDIFAGNGYYSDKIVPIQHAATFPMMSGPPPAVASYNPQYSDPASASMESLQRTFAAAQAGHDASEEDFSHGLIEHSNVLTSFGMLPASSASSDRAQFPSASDSLASFDSNQNYSYPAGHVNNIYGASQSFLEAQNSVEQVGGKTPTQFETHQTALEHPMPQLITTFPSQLLPLHSQDGIPTISNQRSYSQTSDESAASCFSFDFGYDIQQPDENSLIPPPPSTLPFRSPPPPMDIASRRKKVQVKPAALTADTARGRPSMGPRTVSHAEGLRRQSDSPISSPMRRIVSAGGNRNGFSGRIQKPGVESAQRSPINFNGFADASAFMEHNYQNIRNAPTLTTGSTLNNSLAPPTPMSPREREMTLVKRDSNRSTASPTENISFVFDAGVPGCFATMEVDQNLASPPETPQGHQCLQSTSNGWPSTAEFEDKQWHYEVPDEPLYTPGHDAFPSEILMPQPSYLSSTSQPVTPAFGHLHTTFPFGYESPQLKNENPAYNLPTQNPEYAFPESQLHFSPGMLSSPSNKQKTFQFSHSTPADFSEK